jgi:signal transduction histidine kinase
MRVTGLLRRRAIELAWGGFAVANVVAMLLWPSWETIPFHFIWVSLTLVYGFRIWRPVATAAVLAVVAVATGILILIDALGETQPWGELSEVPLMSAMFLAMVWHARRRQDALQAAEREGEERAALLAQQECFLHDVSHELRTPVTIARGHLEVLARVNGESGQEVAVALDELERIERILDRLLVLAKTKQPDFVVLRELDLAAFLEDVFIRWSEVAPRQWHLGSLPTGTVLADPEGLRNALDALLENAVKYTQPGDAIDLRAHASGGWAFIEVVDEGCGVPPEALERIFDRFARADSARTRAHGGVGLGLAIADAIVKAHGGRCVIRPLAAGATFAIELPGFTASASEHLALARAKRF